MRSQRNPLAWKRAVFGVLALWLSLGLLAEARAQSSTVGNISGAVRDPQGGGVPKAEVTILDEKTQTSRTVTTDDTGIYSVPSLPVGRYTVSTAPQGFKKTVATVELHVNENLTVNLNLEIGGAAEIVNVTAEVAQVETQSGEVSSLIAEKQVTELPLNGRNYASLVTMVPGMSPAEGGGFAARGTGLDSHVDLSVNGNASNANMWTVDGVNNMDVGSNATLLVFPSIDAIAEFRVERNSFSAEFGQAQGAVINLITKGGGNQFHGTLFEFLRNDALNATANFLNQAGQPKQKLRYNNFGFNVNGPILKDRLFFFYSEEWRREKRGIVLSAHVPTAAEKQGDFSGSILTGGPPPNDPLTGHPFPGNRIPSNRLSPAGLALMKIFPDPNNPSDPTGTNWISSTLEPVKTRQDLIRGDWTVNSKMNVMVRFINETWQHGNAAGNFWGDTPFPTLSSDWDQPSKSFAVKLTNSFTATTVNEFQFSRAGNDIIVTTNAAGDALNQEIASKFPTVFPRTEGTGLPTVGWGPGGYPTLWHQAPWQNHEDLFIWKDDFSKALGSHTLKFGALASHNIKNEQPNGASGLYTVQTSNTRTGNFLAELLVKDLPILEYSEVDHQENTLGRWHDFEFYGNDTWKARPGLTFTLGMRWSRYSPAYSDNDRISNYVPSLFNGTDPLSGLVRGDQRDAAGLPRSLVNAYNAGFQPRIGIAWDVFGDGKTAVRLGFGRFIGRANVIEDILRMALNPPWSTTVDTGWRGETSLADCPTCRSLDTINPGLKNAVAGVGSSTSFNAVSTNFQPPESWQWNLTVSREVVRDTVVEASYIGNHGLHIWRRGVQYNEIDPRFRLQNALLIRNGGDSSGFTAQHRIFPGLGPVVGSESSGDSHYHALQVWVNRRFANRLSFQAAYTWSHTISNVPLTSFTTATTDPFNYDLDRGDADLDRRHMFVFNTVYVLPTLKSWGPIASGVLGDWQFNGILTLYSGVPIDLTSNTNTAGLASGTQRPNIVPGQPLYLHGSDPRFYLNPAAFAVPSPGQFGNVGRGVVRAPGVENVDFSVNKNWRVRERYGVQFRAEMFNAFNHVNLVNVDNNVTSGTFGQLRGDRGPREIQFGLKFTF